VNHGEEADVFEARFKVNGVTVDTREVEVPGNETAVISFSRTFEQAGTLELAINDQPAGNVTVEEAANETSPEPVSASVESVSSLPASIEAGETVTVEATLANPGNQSIEHTAVLTVNGVAIAERTVTIPPGESVTVTFEEPFEEPGRYEVAIDDEPLGTVEVAATPTPTATDRPATTDRSPATTTAPPDDGIIEQLPGFGHAAALLALVAFVFLMARRRGPS
jgi:archaellum component FlaF (FlaF/FlaG flagellin family)